jgi:hypothetical protein
LSAPVRRCAYCDATGNLTREHLLPHALSLRSDDRLFGNIVAQGQHKVTSAEPTITDVCENCNNGPLSVLDTYACGLYDKHFVEIVRAGDCVKFEFDYDLLLRWLLKTAYNFARARKGQWPIALLAQLREYILGVNPKRPAARVVLQLIKPAKVELGSVKEFPNITESPMFFNRVGLFDFSLAPGFLTGFLITLNSYYFHMFLEDSATNTRSRERVFKRLIKDIPGGFQLVPGKKAVVYPSSLDQFQVAKTSPPLIRNMRDWYKWKK